MKKEINNYQVSENRQIFAIHISMVAATMLFLVSLVVGVISDSITLLLDASAGLVIILVAIFMRKIIKTVNKPPDTSFNFGYGKYEPLTIALQGTMIILSCIIAGKFAIQDIIHPEDITRYDIPALSSIFLFIVSLSMSLHLKNVSKATHSPILKMASYHWRIDCLMSLGMFIGFSFGFFTKRAGFTNITPYIDPVMTLMLIIFFVKAPVEAIMHNGLELLDMAPPKETMEKVKEVVGKHQTKVSGVHSVKSRKAGSKIFIQVCFLAEGNTTVQETEKLAKIFEEDIKEHFSDCDVVVYFKPVIK